MKKFKLKKFKSIVLFNVSEHIYNKEQLIKSINKSLKNGGKLELFVPFMFRYHDDPKDYHRVSYISKKFLRENGFKQNNSYSCRAGNVVSEIYLNI